MSAGKCARCDQTVYSVEGLRCLDKMWHKGCFKCQECGMTLNLKNYKGFEKKPYCNAHCPQAKATSVADTPESRRLAENTRIQSQAKYHEDFEKSKGKNFTTIADDPETVRIKNTSKIISNVSYHGDIERKKQMEEKRGLSGADEATLANVINNNNNHHHQNRMHHNSMPSPHHQQNHPHQRQQEPPTSNYPTQQLHINDQNHQQQHQKLQKQLLEQQQSQLAHQQQALKYNLLKQQQQHQQVLYSHDNIPVAQPPNNRHLEPRQQQHLPPQFTSKHVHPHQQHYPQSNGVNQQQQQQQQMISRQHQAMLQQRHSHQDMNRLSSGQMPMVTTLGVPNPQQQMIRIPIQHQQSPKYGGPPINDSVGHHHQPSPTHLVASSQMTNPAVTLIGNPKVVPYNVNGPQPPQPLIAAYNQRPPPMAAMVNGVVPKQQQHYPMQSHIIRHIVQPGQSQPPPNQQHPQQQQMMQRNQHMQQLQTHYQHQQQPLAVRMYRAIYDYEANDIDEVTFFENDVLINCVDAGGNWLIGKVARTGQEGMFPANYVTEYLGHP